MSERFLRIPFAISGDRVVVPDDAQVDGEVSYEDGYGPDYSANPSVDPDALNIERTKFNSLMFDITSAIRQYQTLGVPDFITSADNDGTAFSYSKYAQVRYDPGSGTKVYQSLVDSNTTLPTDATKWAVVVSFSDGDKGDITVSSDGAAFTIDANAVTTGKIADSNITAAKLATDAVTTVKIVDANVTTAKIADSNITTAKIAANNVTNAKLAQMATLTIKGNNTASTADPIDLTIDQARKLMRLVNDNTIPKLPPSISGFLPVSQTFTSNVISSMGIEGGICTDSTATVIMGYGQPGDGGQWTWNITNGNALNGYQGGITLPNSTTIHFFVICKPDFTSYGTFASTSLTPTLPSTHTGGYYRRIFSLKTNSSGVLPPTNQASEGPGGSIIYFYNISPLDIAITNLGTTATPYTLSVPAGIYVKPFYRYNVPTTGRGIIVACGIQEGLTALPAFSASGWTTQPGYDTGYDNGTTNYVMPKNDGTILTDTASRIYAISTGVSTALYFVTRGFEDFRRG